MIAAHVQKNRDVAAITEELSLPSPDQSGQSGKIRSQVVRLAGVFRLRKLGHSVCAVSGLVTRSPLGMREAGIIGLPVLTKMDLSDPAVVEKIFLPFIRPEQSLLAQAG